VIVCLVGVCHCLSDNIFVVETYFRIEKVMNIECIKKFCFKK